MVKPVSDKRIMSDQIQRITGQISMGVSSTILNTLIMSVVLWDVVSNRRIVVWFLFTVILGLVRILHLRKGAYVKMLAENPARRKKVLMAGLFLSGCVWGSSGIILFPHASLPHQVLIAFVLGGMVAGTVGVFASVMGAFYSFSIPALLPITLSYFLTDDRIHIGMGMMMIIFWIFMQMAAKRLNNEILQYLYLKYENLDLISGLEHEIRDRKLAETELLFKNQQIESIVDSRTEELLRVNNELLNEIDERKIVEAALKESEAQYRELTDSLPQVIFETDLQGKITYANLNAYRLYDMTEDDFEHGINIFQLLDREYMDMAFKQFESILRGEKTGGNEYRARRRDGRTFPIAVHAAPVMKNGRSVGIRGIIIDLTERKKAEEQQKQFEAQLNRAQKMELLGAVAGGVAHDLNNVLSGIVSYPDILLMKIPEDSPLRAPILIIQKSGKKAADMVQDFLTLTRRGVVFEEVVSLNSIIMEYLKSPEHERMISYHMNIDIAMILDDGLLNIMGSRVHLTKTVMNLISNAAEAMPDGGRITISTGNRYLDRPVKGYDEIKEGDYAVLTVSDTGTGIAAADLDRIFEPFFTKKVMGRSGTGLGMAVVWGTVKDHRGYIDVVSAEGEGSTFSIFFPVTRERPGPVDDPDMAAGYYGCGESILVVDDVEEQRNIVSEMLTALGYRVAVAASGEEAVEYLKTSRADLLILDMIMYPGMDGLNTYKKIIEIHPGQKAIIASGYSETERVREAQRIGAGAYIKKPYSLLKLGRIIRDELSGVKPDAGSMKSGLQE